MDICSKVKHHFIHACANFCFSSSYLSLLHENLLSFMYLYTWKNGYLLNGYLCALILLFWECPLPEGVSAIAVNLILFTVIPDGYETGTTVKRVKFFIPCGYPFVPAGYCSKKVFKKKINGGQAFCKK